MNITVYLGANMGTDKTYAMEAKALGTWIGSAGHRLIYGGSRAGLMGILADAVLEAMKEMGEDTSDISVLRCAGGEECRKALLLLRSGRLKEDFVEGMICPGGCIGGPSKHETEPIVMKARNELLQTADDRKILDNLKKYPMDQFSMYRDGHLDNTESQEFLKNHTTQPEQT